MDQIKFEIHMHSTFSDGEFTPSQLVEIAHDNEVSILSLTDHDTFSGSEELAKTARGVGIKTFPGIEITVRYRDFNLHLLGYFRSFEILSSKLKQRVEGMKFQREDRMRNMIDGLNTVIPKHFRGLLEFDNVVRACEGVVGRPHLAKEMARLKIVKDTAEAFENYLVRYNVEKNNIPIEEALHLIRECNGVPVIAHPGERSYSLLNPKRGRKAQDVPPMIEELMTMGLLGLECVYPHHEKSGKVVFFQDLARRYGLIETGSRDFHGQVNNQNRNVLGSTKMDAVFLERFQEVWG